MTRCPHSAAPRPATASGGVQPEPPTQCAHCSYQSPGSPSSPGPFARRYRLPSTNHCFKLPLLPCGKNTTPSGLGRRSSNTDSRAPGTSTNRSLTSGSLGSTASGGSGTGPEQQPLLPQPQGRVAPVHSRPVSSSTAAAARRQRCAGCGGGRHGFASLLRRSSRARCRAHGPTAAPRRGRRALLDASWATSCGFRRGGSEPPLT